MTIAPIQAVGAVDPALLQSVAPTAPTATNGGAFAQMLMDGVARVDQQLTEANSLAASFALDDSIPLHRVTYALEQARLSVELMLQVRSRLVEGYQELMRMQL